MVTKPMTYRLDTETIKRLSAWGLILEKDKTKILKEAIEIWENTQSEENKARVDIIASQL